MNLVNNNKLSFHTSNPSLKLFMMNYVLCLYNRNTTPGKPSLKD